MVDYGWGPVTVNAPPIALTTPKKIEAAATVAFILAIMGICTWGLSSIVALFMAHGAKRNIAVSPETRKGKGLAIAAQIISVVFLLASTGISLALLES